MTDSGAPSDDAYEIREVALTDIRLRHRTPEGYHLILGRHRLEAARQLKWQTIRASVFFDMTAEQAALVEVEGNLVSLLAPDEYANFVVAREEATEDLRDWKTAARRFFGLSKGDTAV
jgi:ParB-like chromosome segregation protein Spo0J